MIDVDLVCDLITEAGRVILEVYRTVFKEGDKEERSPLTLAQKRAWEVISQGLLTAYPDIPILSRETVDVPHSTRLGWPRFWLVDSLDGDAGFMNRNDELTVNIALIEGVVPVLGVIYIPAKGDLYLAAQGTGCWKITGGGRERMEISAPPMDKPVRVLIDRSHVSPDTISLIDLLPSSVTHSRDSALKFCAIASGEADFYPCLDANWEWKTAAGQAIVAEAGAVMIGGDGEILTYNKPQALNGPFLVAPSLDWLKELDVLDYRKRLADWEFEVCASSCR